MSGKGSGRRPQLANEDEVAANWARCFPRATDTNEGQGESQPVEDTDGPPAALEYA